MGNNLFYKALAAISTIGVLVLAGTSLVPEASDKAKELDELIARSKREVIEARKDALVEVNSVRKDALSEVNTAKQNALAEVKAARKDVMNALEKAKKGKSSESVWLVMRYGVGGDGSLATLEMEDMDQCEFQGALYQASKRLSESGYQGYECVEGK